jgi:hypothetical protein
MRVYWSAEINKDKIGGFHSTHRIFEKYIQNFVGKMSERHLLRDLGVYERMILKRNLINSLCFGRDADDTFAVSGGCVSEPFGTVLTTSMHSAIVIWAVLCVVSECFCSEMQLNLPRLNNGCL